MPAAVATILSYVCCTNWHSWGGPVRTRPDPWRASFWTQLIPNPPTNGPCCHDCARAHPPHAITVAVTPAFFCSMQRSSISLATVGALLTLAGLAHADVLANHVDQHGNFNQRSEHRLADHGASTGATLRSNAITYHSGQPIMTGTINVRDESGVDGDVRPVQPWSALLTTRVFFFLPPIRGLPGVVHELCILPARRVVEPLSAPHAVPLFRAQVYYIWYGAWTKGGVEQTLLENFASNIGGSRWCVAHGDHFRLFGVAVVMRVALLLPTPGTTSKRPTTSLLTA